MYYANLIYWWIIITYSWPLRSPENRCSNQSILEVWYIFVWDLLKSNASATWPVIGIRLEGVPSIERWFFNGIQYYIDTEVERFYHSKTEKSENHLVFFIHIMFCSWITYKHLLPLWRVEFRCNISPECIEKWISRWRIAVVLTINKNKKNG